MIFEVLISKVRKGVSSCDKGCSHCRKKRSEASATASHGVIGGGKQGNSQPPVHE